MSIFKYKKYVIGMLATIALFIFIIALIDNAEHKGREISFPGGFLKEEMGMVPRGKYAEHQYFDRGLAFNNGYATVLPGFLNVKDGCLIGVYDDIFGICVYEEKGISDVNSEDVIKLFESTVPDKLNYSVNNTKMTVYRDETGFFGYNKARYLCGYRRSKVSMRTLDEYGFMMVMQTGNDVVIFYVVTTDISQIEDACQYLQDMASMLIMYNDEDIDSDNIIGDQGNVGADDVPLEDYSYKDAFELNHGYDDSSIVEEVIRCSEDKTSGSVYITWSNLADDIQITVYDCTYEQPIELTEFEPQKGYARFRFSNNGGSEFIVTAASEHNIGTLDTVVED